MTLKTITVEEETHALYVKLADRSGLKIKDFMACLADKLLNDAGGEIESVFIREDLCEGVKKALVDLGGRAYFSELSPAHQALLKDMQAADLAQAGLGCDYDDRMNRIILSEPTANNLKLLENKI